MMTTASPVLLQVVSERGRPGLRSLFGLTISTDFPFTVGLRPASRETDLAIELSRAPVLPDPDEGLIYESPYQGPAGESLASLYRMQDHEVLRFPAVADFRIGAREIAAHLPAVSRELAEIQLLGPVLSYWFERQGIPTLHASAVVVNNRAVAFLSNQGGGKTGLAAAMMQAGFPLLTDDVLPVEERGGSFLARPGYPQMRMWPDEAEHFLGGFEDLSLVHPGVSKRRVAVGAGGFGEFHDASLPLACIYLPERVADGPIEIHEISPRGALIELVRHSFSPHLVQAVGLQPARLDRFARLVLQVPVRRLRYPSGFERLPEVVAGLLRN